MLFFQSKLTTELLNSVDEEKGEPVPDGCDYLVHITPHILTPVCHGVLRHHHLYTTFIHVVPVEVVI